MRLLHTADAAVLPSHYEPFGIVALEAAATGTPLVTSNVGGLGEAVINGRTGMSYAPRDVAGLAAAVRVVLDDPAAAQRRAVAARERLTSDFDWQHRRRRDRAGLPGRQTSATANRTGGATIVEHALPDRSRCTLEGSRATAFVLCALGVRVLDIGRPRAQEGPRRT